MIRLIRRCFCVVVRLGLGRRGWLGIGSGFIGRGVGGWCLFSFLFWRWRFLFYKIGDFRVGSWGEERFRLF